MKIDNIVNQININEKNITSKLLISDAFVRDIKKYKDIIYKFLDSVNKNIYTIGIKCLESKKTEKMLTNTKTKVFEFRSPIKGHRIFFKYGWQCDNKNIGSNDIVLCGYENDHDKITESANAIKDIKINQEWTDKFEILECESLEKTFEDTKLYYFNGDINYLAPVLDKEQEVILRDREQFVLVNGIAGSGKTNLCIQKLLLESFSNNKILYSTFSEGLLKFTQEFIYFNYIEKVREIKNQIKTNKLSNATMLKLNNLNFVNLDYSNLENELEEISNQLKNIDYKMLYEILINNKQKVVDFKSFTELYYSKEMVSYDLKNSLRTTNLSLEIVFKEIEGVILGLNSNTTIISFDEYKKERGTVFTDKELEIIYKLGKAYFEYITKSNKYTDKNLIAIQILENPSLKSFYDIIILDEVQDFTQKELLAFKHMSKRIFAVGDPLQMINPTYFSFNKFKQLLGQNHKEYILDLNYRNTKKINSAINKILDINKDRLGYHSNILKQVRTADIQESTYLFYTDCNEVINRLNQSEFDDYTIVVSTDEEKNNFRNKEVLTISEAKGLERNTIILHNILSKNLTEWLKIQNNQTNKKIADENSLLRYYFNIFYVGITRAQRNILIFEDSPINIFKNLFTQDFDYLEKDTSIEALATKLESKILSFEERIERINEAFRNKLFDNAKHYISWIKDNNERKKQLVRLDIYTNLQLENNHDPVIDKCLELNLIDDAIEISKQLKDFETASLLHQIYNTNETDISLLLDVLSNTKSKILIKLIKRTLKESRTELLEKNKLLKEMLREI